MYRPIISLNVYYMYDQMQCHHVNTTSIQSLLHVVWLHFETEFD